MISNQKHKCEMKDKFLSSKQHISALVVDFNDNRSEIIMSAKFNDQIIDVASSSHQKRIFSYEIDTKADIFTDWEPEMSEVSQPVLLNEDSVEDIKPDQGSLNKIILGSKPSTLNETDYEDFFKLHLDQERSYNVNLVLNDLKPYLRASGRFCQHCGILFPNKNSYDSHLVTFHPNQQRKPQSTKWKAVYKKRKQLENTIRSKNSNLKNVRAINAQSQRLILRMISDFESGNDKLENRTIVSRRCFHCDKSFSSQQALIEHLYKILYRNKKKPSNKRPRPIKSLPKTSSSDGKVTEHDEQKTESECYGFKEKPSVKESDKKTKTNDQCPNIYSSNGKVTEHDKQKTESKGYDYKENPSVNESDKKTRIYFRCPICSAYHENRQFLISHLHKVHDIYDINSSDYLNETSCFNSVCEYCASKFTSPKIYNNHLYWRHEHFFFEQKLPGTSRVPQSKVVQNANQNSEENNELNNKKIQSSNSSLQNQEPLTHDDEEQRNVKHQQKKVYKCCICYIFTSSLFNMHRHLKKNHSINRDNINELFELTTFDKTCGICREVAKHSIQSLNVHIYSSHKSMYYSKNLKTNVDLKDDSDVSKFFKCRICSFYALNYLLVLEHLKKNHAFKSMSVTKEFYEITYFDPKCEHCSKHIDTKRGMNAHISLGHKNIYRKNIAHIAKYQESISFDKFSPEERLYQCYICAYFLPSVRSYKKHLALKHKVKDITQTCNPEIFKNIKFDSKCKYCSQICPAPKHYNLHLESCHKNLVNSRVLNEKDKTCDRNQDEVECTRLEHESESIPESKVVISNKVIEDYNKKVKPPKSNTEIEKHSENDTPIAGQNSSGVKLTDLFAKKVPEKVNETLQNNKISSTTVKTIEKTVPNKIQGTSHKIFLLRSAIFQCLKCDIHFLSATNAKNHINHPEMLINWKCPVCKNIFKEEDRILHEKQHMFFKNFEVHGLHPDDSSQILFHCSKCTVHFDEKTFMRHYSKCEEMTPRSTYCKVCDILIFDHISKTHWLSHVNNDLKAIDLKIVYSDVETLNSSSQLNPKETKTPQVILKRVYPEVETLNSSQLNPKEPKTSQVILNRVFSDVETLNSSQLNPKEPKTSQVILKRVYPDVETLNSSQLNPKEPKTSQVILNRVYSDVETLNSSQLNPKETKTSQVILKRQKRFRNQLNSFNLYLCHTCKCFTHGVRTKPHMRQDCVNFPKRACTQCGLTFSMSSFVKHQLLHDMIQDLNLNHFIFYDYRGKNINPPRPDYKECEKCHVNFFNMDKESHSCGDIYKKCNACELNFDLEGYKLDKLFHKYYEEIPYDDDSVDKGKKETGNGEEDPDFVQSLLTLKKCSKELEQAVNASINDFDNILYQCKDCLVTVDSYDKLILHCQNHFTNNGTETASQQCSSCYLLIDSVCYDSHKTLHEKHKNENYFTVLDVDLFYFTSNNKTWTDHVFRVVPPDAKQKIISKSIYKHECRIKMHLVQNGAPELTVYSCNKCVTCIDESSLFQHAQNSCFNVRNHECTFCNIPFNSAEARLQHENIHQTPGITCRSLRVISFNRKEDRHLDESLFRRSKYFVLYVCRSCSIVVDKSQKGLHRCMRPNTSTCPTCGLLLNNEFYKSHCLRHKYIEDFRTGNIKLILFGSQKNNTHMLAELVTLYQDAVFDYKLYSCPKCNVCAKFKPSLYKHRFYCCGDSSSTSKQQSALQCSICKYYFLTPKSLKVHLQEHDNDLDFSRDNIIVVKINAYQFSNKQNKSETKQNEGFVECMDAISLDEESSDKDSIFRARNRAQSFALKLKHTVGIREVVELDDKLKSATTHYTQKEIEMAEHYQNTLEENARSDPKIIHQKCESSESIDKQKEIIVEKLCDKVSPTIESQRKKHSKVVCKEYDTATTSSSIESNSRESRTTIYKCKCGLHFIDQSTVLIHSKSCSPKLSVPKHKCPKCHLVFTPKILFTHLLMHHGNKNYVYTYDIIDMTIEYMKVYVCLKCEHAELRVNKPEQDKCPNCYKAGQIAIPLEIYNRPSKEKDTSVLEEIEIDE